jgi:hypothetical protein
MERVGYSVRKIETGAEIREETGGLIKKENYRRGREISKTGRKCLKKKRQTLVQ